MINISEKNFEESIECTLLNGGPDACSDNEWTSRKLPSSFGDFTSGSYRKRRPDQYDRHLYLDPDAVWTLSMPPSAGGREKQKGNRLKLFHY